MLFTSWRMVPLMALASRDSFAAANVSLPPSFVTFTSSVCARESEPPLPLTLIWSSLMATSTPVGTATGIFPTRDIFLILPLGDVAQHFATDTGSTCLAVRHHALRRGHDRHAQAVHDLGNGGAALVDAQAGAAHALDTLDHRTAGVVLQVDQEFGLAVLALHLEAVDVTLVLQHLGDGDLHFGRRHAHGSLGDHLRVTDTRQQVGDGITHAHRSLSSPLTSWPW